MLIESNPKWLIDSSVSTLSSGIFIRSLIIDTIFADRFSVNSSLSGSATSESDSIFSEIFVLTTLLDEEEGESDFIFNSSMR